ncbi:BRCA1 C Terminus (BRCT) domain [Geosmithia morbida]|uniref:BRCA1 C Terminus (BRCT) domain n=1 Tax=Geosmithia morbida TaxID=1094350 RepID=A0A9P5D1F8_9HYPO|nr:BRCA1 C Terminus (BRCT) domain [Geosmithia morbida]KAF4119795.1 BRCA1 C Terminus (BRCT) domain [Geosmithia morbida]
MESPTHHDEEQLNIDPAEPFKGIIVCCTSIPPEYRADIAQKVSDLGGVHKYDLTPDVTHLIVGDYDTPKYRHVARERPDIRAMDASWVEAVSQLWKDDEPIDFLKLEREHQLRALEMKGSLPRTRDAEPPSRQSLLICLTGFGHQRDEIVEKIMAGGGRHTDDLTRRCTHLIVNKPEGKKFTAARSWNIRAVTLAWLEQSVQRGMILEEDKFDPLLPVEEQGVGAWVKRDFRRPSLGKRARSTASVGAEEGTRKLRKTASMKLSSQRNNLWGDILGRSDSRDYSFVKENERRADEEPTQPIKQEQDGDGPAATREAAAAAAVPANPRAMLQSEKEGIFSDCIFYIHGFTQQRTTVLSQTIIGLDGLVAPTLREAADSQVTHRFLIVPQTSQPDGHPSIENTGVHIITEFYVEKCMHNRRFFPPSDHHALGRPFPMFPIPDFASLTICTAAFTGIELSQVARSVAQLGARFEEQFRRSTSVLVVRSLDAMRKDKLRAALAWGIPVVSADWLWECISTGYNVPTEDFIFPELRGRLGKRVTTTATAAAAAAAETTRKTTKTISPEKVAAAKGPIVTGVDPTAFGKDDDEVFKVRQPTTSKRLPIPQDDSSISADFNTARTHATAPRKPTASASSAPADPPLRRLSPSSANKSPSPPKQIPLPDRSTSLPSPVDDKQKDDGKRRGEEGEEEEEARLRAAKAAERQALTTKLTTLLDASASSSIEGAASTAPQAEDASSGANPRPQRRRQILGRAISNASAGSDVHRQQQDDDHGDDGRGQEQEQPPPATQIGYHDPEAQNRKAALMDRMMGGSGEVKSARSASTSVVGVGRSMRKR